MSAHTEHSVSASGGSLFVVAAWYSFLIPLLSPVIWFAIVAGTGGYLGVAFMSALCILITSLVSGVVSLFGFSRHGRKRIRWMALIGIVASIILGFMSYGYWELSQNWHG
jgi:positive regulator of sigma E activity